jgi:hypothetical protein
MMRFDTHLTTECEIRDDAAGNVVRHPELRWVRGSGGFEWSTYLQGRGEVVRRIFDGLGC